jgi:DNA helicase-2/ATP-dependent DNA helicase PcrA
MSREYVLEPFHEPATPRIDYARELNEQQYAAVTAPPGPSLVIAGAGSGKTRTLIYRVAFLLEQGIPPERILLLTFTNKAAREMMRRVAALLGQELGALWGGTFHAVGNRILRQHARLLGYRNAFTILDREDAKHLIGACIGESEIDIKATRFPKPEVLAELFSLSANKLQSLAQTIGEQHEDFCVLTPQVELIRQRYTERKLINGAMDFDDLLLLWLKLMKEQEDLREHYQRRFQFILVDEYQDTNKLQSELIDLLSARHHNLMVVGDDAQSIYAWRGAHFENIIQFPDRYPDAKVYRIETNYRSTPEILEVANSAITNNARQFAKKLSAARKPGMKPALVACQDAQTQSAFVAQRVLQLRDEGVKLDDMAVLYRSHFHALELQLELTKRNIPFSITSGIRFFEQAHLKDVTAWLKFITNPRDELSFKRLVLLLPGIGNKGADKLWKTLLPGLESLDLQSPTPVARLLQPLGASAPKKAAVGWAQFTATVAQLEGPQIRGNASAMIRLVLEAGYEAHLKETYDNYRSRIEDVQQLSVFAQQFQQVEDFLGQMALLTNLEAEDDQPANKDDERLRLSTVHQAKGLEFDVVFVIMLCEGLFPSNRSMELPEGLEEERRLMYVAMTRAKNELYLSFPLIRASYGGSGDAMQRPSRFVTELPKGLLEEWNLTVRGGYYGHY